MAKEAPKPKSDGHLRPPPRPPNTTTAGAAGGDNPDGTIRISLPPKSKETVRIGIPKDSNNS